MSAKRSRRCGTLVGGASVVLMVLIHFTDASLLRSTEGGLTDVHMGLRYQDQQKQQLEARRPGSVDAESSFLPPAELPKPAAAADGNNAVSEDNISCGDGNPQSDNAAGYLHGHRPSNQPPMNRRNRRRASSPPFRKLVSSPGAGSPALSKLTTSRPPWSVCPEGQVRLACFSDYIKSLVRMAHDRSHSSAGELRQDAANDALESTVSTADSTQPTRRLTQHHVDDTTGRTVNDIIKQTQPPHRVARSATSANSRTKARRSDRILHQQQQQQQQLRRGWHPCPVSADRLDCFGNLVRLYVTTVRQLRQQTSRRSGFGYNGKMPTSPRLDFLTPLQPDDRGQHQRANKRASGLAWAAVKDAGVGKNCDEEQGKWSDNAQPCDPITTAVFATRENLPADDEQSEDGSSEADTFAEPNEMSSAESKAGGMPEAGDFADDAGQTEVSVGGDGDMANVGKRFNTNAAVIAANEMCATAAGKDKMRCYDFYVKNFARIAANAGNKFVGRRR